MKTIITILSLTLLSFTSFGQLISTYNTIMPPNDSFSSSSYIIGKNSQNKMKEVAAEFRTDSLSIPTPFHSARFPFSGTLTGSYKVELWTQSGSVPGFMIPGSEIIFNVASTGTNIITVIGDSNNIVLEPDSAYYLVVKAANATSRGNWNFSVFHTIQNNTFIQTDTAGFTPYINTIPAFEIIAGIGSPTNLSAISSESNPLSIYPNPAHNILNVDLEGSSSSYSFQIINSTGQVLSIQQSNSNKNQLDVSQLPRGIYFIRQLDKNRHIVTCQFVKE